MLKTPPGLLPGWVPWSYSGLIPYTGQYAALSTSQCLAERQRPGFEFHAKKVPARAPAKH